MLTDWIYPIVCDTNTGSIEFDNHLGKWGCQEKLDEFVQAYAVEKAMIEARKAGHTASEQLLADGSIRVCVQVA